MSGFEMISVDPERVKRVLAVKLTSLGDIVHVTPCVRALRRRFPRARIFMAVDRRFADAVRHDPNIDGLIEVGPESPGWRSRLVAAWPSLSPHAEAGFDLAVDFQGVPRSALYVYWSRARIQAGRGGLRPGWECVVRPDLSRHAIEVCADVARALGVPVTDLTPEVHLSAAADEGTRRALDRAGVTDGGFLLVSPFSRWLSKDWPLDRYARLIERLTRDRRLAVVLSGSAERMDAAAHLLSLLGPGRTVSLVGRLSLGEAMCLYRRAAVMVTGDSGPMHLGAALGTRLVALFGPTFPERTGPWGDGHRVIQKKRPRSPYAYLRDRAGVHIAAIDVDTVYAAVAAALDEWASARRAPSATAT